MHRSPLAVADRIAVGRHSRHRARPDAARLRERRVVRPAVRPRRHRLLFRGEPPGDDPGRDRPGPAGRRQGRGRRAPPSRRVLDRGHQTRQPGRDAAAAQDRRVWARAARTSDRRSTTSTARSSAGSTSAGAIGGRASSTTATGSTTHATGSVTSLGSSATPPSGGRSAGSASTTSCPATPGSTTSSLDSGERAWHRLPPARPQMYLSAKTENAQARAAAAGVEIPAAAACLAW